MKYCIFTIGSITRAQKAKRALSALGIQSRIVKSDRGGKSSTCAFGIEFDCNNTIRAAAELKSKNIDYTLPE